MPRVDLNVIAPDFSLEAWDGKAVNLSDFKIEKNVMLVFNRGFV